MSTVHYFKDVAFLYTALEIIITPPVVVSPTQQALSIGNHSG